MLSTIMKLAIPFIFLILGHSSVSAVDVIRSPSPLSLAGSLSNVENWNDLRYKGIIRQEHDYSCGAASLATLINNLYHLSYSESDILDLVETESAALTMADLKSVTETLGFIGFGAEMKTLEQMNFMFIVHLKPLLGDYEHYSVVESVGSDTVTLADSAWGRKVFPINKFLDMWLIHQADDGTKVGYIFGVLPQPEHRDVIKNSLKTPRSLIPEQIYRLLSMQSILNNP